MDEENSVSDLPSSRFQGILINILLILLIGYLGYYFWQSHRPSKPKASISLATVNSYGQPAYIGTELNRLVPYDVDIPIFEGCYFLLENGGHIIFTMQNQIEVSLKNKVLIRFEKNGIDILEGVISLQHPSGKFPDSFKVYKQGVNYPLPNSPITVQ